MDTIESHQELRRLLKNDKQRTRTSYQPAPMGVAQLAGVRPHDDGIPCEYPWMLIARPKTIAGHRRLFTQPLTLSRHTDSHGSDRQDRW